MADSDGGGSEAARVKREGAIVTLSELLVCATCLRTHTLRRLCECLLVIARYQENRMKRKRKEYQDVKLNEALMGAEIDGAVLLQRLTCCLIRRQCIECVQDKDTEERADLKALR